MWARSMSEIKSPGDCTDTGCIAPKKPQPVIIDFLYIDANAANRWQDSLSSLNEAIAELSSLLNSSGLYIQVNKTLIDTAEKAVAHRFVCSPTIAINGVDIAETTQSSINDADLRVWVYKGATYSTAPKSLIISAIIKAIYGATIPIVERPYSLPSSLQKYFDTKLK